MARELTRDAFVSQLIDAYGVNTDAAGALHAIPVIVGAGISVSADIPGSDALIKGIWNSLEGGDDLSFEAVYKGIAEKFDAPDYRSLRHKIELRRQLRDAGIPRVGQRPAPNPSNLAIVHLLRSRLLAPIISLNVDPLLSIAAEAEQDEGAAPIKFVTNASQFSDIAGGGELSQVVLQVHGSIEEPLSLRFLNDELCDKEAAIFSALVSAARNSFNVFCIGSSISDEVVPRFLEEWAASHRSGTRDLRFFAAFRSAPSANKLARLEGRVRGALRRSDIRFEVLWTRGTGSDELLQAVVDRAYDVSMRDRARDRTTYYVPKMTRALLRNRLGVLAVGEEHRFRQPPPWKALQIETMLHAIQARGPFTVTDLVRCSSIIKRLGSEIATSHNPGLSRLFRDLVDGEVLSFDGSRGPERFETNEAPEAGGIGEIRRLRFIRHAGADDPAVFVQRCLRVLGFVGSSEQWTKAGIELGEMMIELERSGASEFLPSQAIPLAAYFDGAVPIATHRELDARLDLIKKSFEEAAKRAASTGGKIRCHVVTEVGQHLFQPEKLLDAFDADSSGLDEEEVRRAVAPYLRPWLVDIYLADSPDQTVDLYLASETEERLFKGSAGDTRSDLEQRIVALMAGLSRSRSIRIYYVPREHHSEHMWYYHTGDAPTVGGAAKGVYFPTQFDERPYCAVEVSGQANIGKLSLLREMMPRRRERFMPAPDGSASRVMAITIVDDSDGLFDRARIEQAKMLVCVRSPETNADHGSVASVPTRRVSPPVFDELFGLADWDSNLSSLDTIQCSRSYAAAADTFISSARRTGDNILVDAVNDLLARKFNLGDAIEERRIRFRTKPLIVRTGVSPKVSEYDSPDREYISILNAVVLLETGADLFPVSSKSYSHLQWVTVSEFIRAVGEDGQGKFEFDDGATYLYGGLCVCSADLLLTLMKQASVPAP